MIRLQTLQIIKTNRKVGSSRIVGDHYAVMTDLHKFRQQTTHVKDVIHNEGRPFTPKLPNKIAPTVGVNGDQATLEEESVEKITDILRCEDRQPPGLLKDDSPQQSSDLSEHPPV